MNDRINLPDLFRAIYALKRAREWCELVDVSFDVKLRDRLFV